MPPSSLVKTFITPLFATVSLLVPGPGLAASNTISQLTPLLSLEQTAHSRVAGKARVSLADVTSDVFVDLDSLEKPGSGQVPNYVRSMAMLPKLPPAFSHLFKTFVSNSAVPSETKLAMALRISQINNSPYTTAHVERLLKATDRGKVLLEALRSSNLNTLTESERQAISYGDALTRQVHGLSDSQFEAARSLFNDSQIVELSFTTCFFNYFTRYVEALNLPVEPWVFETSPAPLKAFTAVPARVSLVSDEEFKAGEATLAASRAPNSLTAKWGIGIANSQRAMMHAPQMFMAWRGFGAAFQEYASVSREIKLQVSLAVSTSNGCRYCTLHQVLGLRRLGVDPAKLLSLQKDDSQLTPAELTAVTFARQLTVAPGGTTDSDYDSLRTTFTEQGALEVLMQTCNFAFMNRFTDGLRLPSEDEAVKVYHETYGVDWQPATK